MTAAEVKWKWTPEHEEFFDQIKALMAKETPLKFQISQKNLKFILMPVNCNLEIVVTHKEASQWHFILENCKQPKLVTL